MTTPIVCEACLLERNEETETLLDLQWITADTGDQICPVCVDWAIEACLHTGRLTHHAKRLVQCYGLDGLHFIIGAIPEEEFNDFRHHCAARLETDHPEVTHLYYKNMCVECSQPRSDPYESFAGHGWSGDHEDGWTCPSCTYFIETLAVMGEEARREFFDRVHAKGVELSRECTPRERFLHYRDAYLKYAGV